MSQEVKNKIAFIIPYFGKFPSFFPFFINSCQKNPQIDFLFFTDIIPSVTPENVKINKMSISEFNELASSKLSIPVNITKFYKICDLKVAYGKIFEDHLFQYDFWGSCDIDVILGDIRSFLTDEKLNNLDIYSGVKWYLSGSLFIFRNTETLKNLFKLSKDYKKVFQSDENYFFEECGPLWHELAHGVDIFSLNSEIETITHVILNPSKTSNLRIIFTDDILEKTNGKVLYTNGKIINDGKEYIMLHFIYLKTKYYFIINHWTIIPPDYFIDCFGFHSLNEMNPLQYIFNGNFRKIILMKSSLLFKRLRSLNFKPSGKV